VLELLSQQLTPDDLRVLEALEQERCSSCSKVHQPGRCCVPNLRLMQCLNCYCHAMRAMRARRWSRSVAAKGAEARSSRPPPRRRLLLRT
jgi:hypothetical protein